MKKKIGEKKARIFFFYTNLEAFKPIWAFEIQVVTLIMKAWSGKDHSILEK